MKIQVLGSGCSTCKSLYEMVQKSAKEMGTADEVEYITDINKLVEEGIATSPVLKIDGKIVCAGRIPSEDEIKEYITKPSDKNSLTNQGCACGGRC
ncbi:arsenic metallochaperone ArsD family protein [Candidatus Dojkabacteria bacterium]|nr:arsenic metallochaperone ArsD family protein [Candidatus Dojkabacteria bacterium]